MDFVLLIKPNFEKYYQTYLQPFLTINREATELDYLEMVMRRIERNIYDIEFEINFFDELKDNAVGRGERSFYWEYKAYKKYIAEKYERLKVGKHIPREMSFNELFKDSGDIEFVTQCMVKLGITDIHGNSIMATSKRSALWGFICALVDKQIIYSKPAEELTKAFTKKIGTYYSRLKSDSNTYDVFYTKTKTLISERRTK